MWTSKERLDTLIHNAESYVILNDRNLYIPVLCAIEQFASSRGMIIGGSIGERILLGQTQKLKAPDLWVLELYSPNIVEDVNACISMVYETLIKYKSSEDKQYRGDERTLILKTIIENREYQIWSDYRLVAICRSLGERKGINIIDIISPVIGKGLFSGADVLIMPRDLQIMRILHLLCSPGVNAAIAKQWKDLIEHLYTLFDTRVIEGGAHDDVAEYFDTAHITNWDNLSSEGILIGEIAANTYLGKKSQYGRAQYLCSFDGFNSYVEHGGVNMTFNDLRAPDDFRLRKIIIKTSNDEKFIADIFNAPDYELVPYVVRDGHKIASPFCVLRFLYVDIWSLDFIAKLMPESVNTRKNKLHTIARELFEWIIECEDITLLFPTTYAGTHILESDTKRAHATTKKSPAPKVVFPAQKNEMIALVNELAKNFSMI